jgi:hypothetical protein
VDVGYSAYRTGLSASIAIPLFFLSDPIANTLVCKYLFHLVNQCRPRRRGHVDRETSILLSEGLIPLKIPPRENNEQHRQGLAILITPVDSVLRR